MIAAKFFNLPEPLYFGALYWGRGSIFFSIPGRRCFCFGSGLFGRAPVCPVSVAVAACSSRDSFFSALSAIVHLPLRIKKEATRVLRLPFNSLPSLARQTV